MSCLPRTGSPRALVLACLALVTAPVLGCGSAALSLGAPLASPTLDPPRRRFAAGDAALCAIRAPGELLCWGGSLGGDRLEPLGGLVDVVEVAVGDGHVCALRASGEVLCFGKNDDGQLGEVGRPGEKSSALRPVPGLPRAVRVAAYDETTCIVTENGEVYCFGKIATLVPGAPNRAPPTRVPGLLDISQVAVGPSVACAVRHDGTAICWGGTPGQYFREELIGVHDALEIATSGILRCARRRAREGRGGSVTCSLQPSPTQGVGDLEPGGGRWSISARDATDLSVDWATACVVRAGGRVECTGYDGGRPVDARGLSDLDDSDAFTLVQQHIGCGVDARGGVHTTAKAVGFCGELQVVKDGRGNNPSRGGGSSYSADLAPALRLGASWLSGGPTDVAFSSGLHVPLLFGTSLQAGPFVDLDTRAFGTFEPTAGLGLATTAGLLFIEADTGLGHAFAPAGQARSFVGFTGRLGVAGHLDSGTCDSGCGFRYLSSAALELSVRRSLEPGRPNDVGLFFSFDPIVLALPFAVLGTSWNFR